MLDVICGSRSREHKVAEMVWQQFYLQAMLASPLPSRIGICSEDVTKLVWAPAKVSAVHEPKHGDITSHG